MESWDWGVETGVDVKSEPVTSRCPGGIDITPEGFRVCRDTGEILEENVISDEPERFFKEDPRSMPRTGSPITLTRHDMGIEVSLKPKRDPNPLRRAGRVIKGVSGVRVLKSDKSKVSVLQLANYVASRLELPRSARENLGYILQLYMSKGKVSGDLEMKCLVAAALLKVIEMHNLGISQNEVLEHLEGVDSMCIWNAKTKLYEAGVLTGRFRTADSQGGQERLLRRVETFILKIVSELRLGDEVKTYAIEFVKAAQRNGKNLYGKRPETVAAAAVYLVARLYGYDIINQSTVAQVVKIKESNVRKLYRYLMSGMVVIVPL